MQTSCTHPKTVWWPAHRDASAPRLHRLWSLARAILPRFLRHDDGMAERYSGCSWGDETERRLTGDILR
jgi:hypothetical protein